MVTDILKSVHFLVDREGKPTAAVLDIAAWEEFLPLLEELEDIQLTEARAKNWPSEEGWTPWESFEHELDSDV